MEIEQRICGVRASLWTKVIAWIQIAVNAILSIWYIFVLVDALKFFAQLENNDFVSQAKTRTIAICTVQILRTLLAVVFAILLLQGSIQKRTGYLKAWMFYTIVSLVLILIVIIMQPVVQIVVIGVIWIAGNVFCVIIVYMHNKDITNGVFR